MLEHLLVPLDSSPLAECVLPHVVALARVFGARVTLFHVMQTLTSGDAVSIVDPLTWQLRRAEVAAYLEEVGDRLSALGVRTEKVVREGQAAERIIEFAHEQDVALILLSSHGRGGLSEWNISSVVQKVILRAYKPTLIARAYQPPTGELTGTRYERLLVPLDGSHRAECILPMACALARHHDATLVLAHVVAQPEVPRHIPLTREEAELVDRLTLRNREEAQRYLDDLVTQLPVRTSVRLMVRGNPAAALHEVVSAEEIDLVVLSAHGYSGEAQWPYGSVALNIIVYGTSPLLIVQDLAEAEIARSAAERAATEHKGH